VLENAQRGNGRRGERGLRHDAILRFREVRRRFSTKHLSINSTRPETPFCEFAFNNIRFAFNFFQVVRRFTCQRFDFSEVVHRNFPPVGVFTRPVRTFFPLVLQIFHLVGVFRPPATSANRLPSHNFRLVRVSHHLPFMTNRLPDRSNRVPFTSNRLTARSNRLPSLSNSSPCWSNRMTNRSIWPQSLSFCRSYLEIRDRSESSNALPKSKALVIIPKLP
jgi:hypothetical protein